MVKDKKTYETNKFYYYAMMYNTKLTSEEDLRLIDFTEEFWEEIEHEIKSGEQVNININAKVRMGKSTLAIYIGGELFRMLVKYDKSDDKKKFGMGNIARDQQEYSKLMRDPKTKNTVLVVDEINELEDTGENVSVERSLTNVFSNIHAGRYVHKVSCSPKEVGDPNADIFLDIVSVDKIRKTTHCHLYYRWFKGGTEYLQLLGHVNFNVSSVVKNWDKVEKVFMKDKKSSVEEKLIARYRKKDFYVEYMIKKYEKMELLTSEGIFRPRMLDYAEILLAIEKRLRILADIRSGLLNKGTIKNYIRMYCREMKIVTSLIGEEQMSQQLEGVLSLWKDHNKVKNMIIRLNVQFADGKINRDEYEVKASEYKRVLDELDNIIKSQIGEWERYREINKKYNEVLS